MRIQIDLCVLCLSVSLRSKMNGGMWTKIIYTICYMLYTLYLTQWWYTCQSSMRLNSKRKGEEEDFTEKRRCRRTRKHHCTNRRRWYRISRQLHVHWSKPFHQRKSHPEYVFSFFFSQIFTNSNDRAKRRRRRYVTLSLSLSSLCPLIFVNTLANTYALSLFSFFFDFYEKRTN